MKELSRKVFLTVLGMLSLFLTLSVVLVNVVGYRREYEGVRRNLGLMNDHGMGPRDPLSMQMLQQTKYFVSTARIHLWSKICMLESTHLTIRWITQ